MEYVNKIELCGYVGSVHKFDIGDTRAARFSLSTAEHTKDQDGIPVIETTWFNCIAFKGDKIDLSLIEKSNKLKVSGRVRQYRYTGQSGTEVVSYEIICNEIKAVE